MFANSEIVLPALQWMLTVPFPRQKLVTLHLSPVVRTVARIMDIKAKIDYGKFLSFSPARSIRDLFVCFLILIVVPALLQWRLRLSLSSPSQKLDRYEVCLFVS